jgi:glyoxylase-like metal-dependent hydrolase (beta-lactamase superfamily II)
MRRHIIAAVTALSFAACARPADETAAGDAAPATSAPQDAASAPAPAGVRLFAFDCGEGDVLDLGVFDIGGAYAGRTSRLVIPCFLVRHPQGDLVWDAGLPGSLAATPEGVVSGPFAIRLARTIESQLLDLGLAPEDIEYFSASHSHFDHVGDARVFAGATFIVSAAERAYMFRDEARANAEEFAAYAPLEAAETVEFAGDHDVFGDGAVEILSTPGHTPGHTVLKLRLANAGTVLLTGDLYHFREAREKRTIPTWNTDPDQTRASMDRFETIVADTGARVIIQHDPEDYAALPKPPEYLD